MRVRLVLLLLSTLIATNDVVATATFSSKFVSTDGIQSTRILRSYDMTNLDDSDNDEERLKFDVNKLIDPTKINEALKDATKTDELFTSWAKTSLISDDVIKALSKTPLQNEQLISAFEQYKIKISAYADDLLSDRTNIETALKDFNSREEMFKTWFANEAVSDSIVAKLSKEFEKNKHILLPFNDYRTKHVYGEKLGGWLRTSELDSIHEGMQVSGMAQMKKTFGEWYKLGKTGDDLKAAFKDRPDLEKKYKMITVAYPSYVQKQVKEKERLEMLAHLAKAQGGDR